MIWHKINARFAPHFFGRDSYIPPIAPRYAPGLSPRSHRRGASSDPISLGRHADNGQIGDKILYGGDQHVLVFGPNGKGKGTRVLMPNLLQSSGSSIVVVDPKGELAAVTAAYRRKLGRVVILNPFGVLADRPGYEHLKSDGFNPLAAMSSTSPSFNADAARLADALVRVEGSDPHWTQSARALIAALIMFVVLERENPEIGAEFRPPPMMARRGDTWIPLLGEGEGRAPLGTMARVRELLCLPIDEPNKANGYRGSGLPGDRRV